MTKVITLNPCHDVYFYIPHSSTIFILLTCYIPVVSIYFQSERIIYVDHDQMALLDKPADLNLQCFHKRINRGPARQGLMLPRVIYI